MTADTPRRGTVLERLRVLLGTIRDSFARPAGRAAGAATNAARRMLSALVAEKSVLVLLALGSALGYLLYRHPPVKSVPRGEVGVRFNAFSGELSEWRDGTVLVVPGVHQWRVLSLRDRTYRPERAARADGPAPLQSLEGLSSGVDIAVRYALVAAKRRGVANSLPDDIPHEIVEPAVQGVIYKVFARYTVREICSTKRAELQQAIEAELGAKLAADGIALRGVVIGKVDLPID